MLDSGQREAGPLDTRGPAAAPPIGATGAGEWTGLPSALTPALVAALQRSAGNRAVTRLLLRMAPGTAGHIPLVGAVAGGIYGALAAGLAYQGQFKAEVQAARSRPVWRAEWDAWGHAVTGAYTTAAGSAGEAHALGSTIEAAREGLRGLGIMAHDSYGTGHLQPGSRARHRHPARRGGSPRRLHARPTWAAACRSGRAATPCGFPGCRPGTGRRCSGTKAARGCLPRAPMRPTRQIGSKLWTPESAASREAGTATPDSPLPAGIDGVEYELSNPHADLS